MTGIASLNRKDSTEWDNYSQCHFGMPLFACQKNGYSILEALSERCSFLKTTVSPGWSQFFSMSFPKGIQPWLGGRVSVHGVYCTEMTLTSLAFPFLAEFFFSNLVSVKGEWNPRSNTSHQNGKMKIIITNNHTFCGDKFQGGYTNHHQLPTHKCPKTRDDPYAPRQFAPTQCGSPLGDLERQRSHRIGDLHVKKCLGSLWKKSTSPKL